MKIVLKWNIEEEILKNNQAQSYGCFKKCKTMRNG